VRQQHITALAEYAQVSIAFTVESVLDISTQPDGGTELTERGIPQAYVRDYDALEPPNKWADRFDLTNWCLLAAYRWGERVGGAAIAFDTPAIELLEGRSDLAILWDLRVRPDTRHQGVGSALFGAAEEWARRHRCTELKIETQNVNAAACRFYRRHGCVLRTVNRGAYTAFPDDIQLLWYRDLR
jgi:GNAT superfamily N-acetyltransferase